MGSKGISGAAEMGLLKTFEPLVRTGHRFRYHGDIEGSPIHPAPSRPHFTYYAIRTVQMSRASGALDAGRFVPVTLRMYALYCTFQLFDCDVVRDESDLPASMHSPYTQT